MLTRNAIESIRSGISDQGRRLAARAVLATAILAAPVLLVGAEAPSESVLVSRGDHPLMRAASSRRCTASIPEAAIGIDDRMSASEPPKCNWASGFLRSDLSGGVSALTVYDDGSGEALYVGGSFAAAGAVEANNLAKWDGTSWSALSGPAGTGVEPYVSALAVYNDGGGEALYAGGQFSNAGGVEVNRVAKWDGTGWSALSGPSGTGVNGEVRALAVYNDGSGEALYVGGRFTFAGRVEVNGITKWDGTDWSTLSGPSGTGVLQHGWVHALAVYDDGSGEALYAGGEFTTAGGAAVYHITKWDGAGWSALRGPSATGTDGPVHALAVYDDGRGEALYAGGKFLTAGGVPLNSIARWDGAVWSALSGPSGTGVQIDWRAGEVKALGVYDDGAGEALYAAGNFLFAGGVWVDGMAKWDGTEWSALSRRWGLTNMTWALAVYDDGGGEALYAGGSITTADGVEANGIAKWDGTEWSALSEPSGMGMNASVQALAVYDDGGGEALYAGGAFTTAGGVEVDLVAKWDGSGWSALSEPTGTGFSDRVSALAVYDDGGGDALYAGGRFFTLGEVEVNHIAKWDGTGWSALSGPAGAGVSHHSTFSPVRALAVYDDGEGEALYAGGTFTTAGGAEVNYVAKWDGTGWSALSGPADTGMNGSVSALAVYDDGEGEALYAGGGFTTAGGVEVNYVAKWDGTGWSALSEPSGMGLNGSVYALAVYDDGGGEALYAGGGFSTAGGVEVRRIAKWDVAEWTALTGPSGTGVYGLVHALAVYDDGGGEALYAGGHFFTAGGVEVNSIARWDGTGWSALTGPSGMGVNGHEVLALAVYDDDRGAALYAGGLFTAAGGVPSWFIAKFDCFSIFSDGFESGDTSAWSRISGGF